MFAKGPPAFDDVFCFYPLVFSVVEYATAVLRPGKVGIFWCMKGKEQIQNIMVGHLGIVKGDANGFGKVLDVLVSWIGCGCVVGASIANDGIQNTAPFFETDAIKVSLGTPESPHGKFSRASEICRWIQQRTNDGTRR